jgi:hypothetical protein
MKNFQTFKLLVALITILALISAGLGVFLNTGGAPFEFTTVRGETVTINGQGLYYYDSQSAAVQAQAQDLVTLVIGIPLLIISTVWARSGSLRGKLLLSGTLAYFLYTYASYAFGAAFNPLYLVYVALFSLSLAAFIISMMSIDLESLPRRFSERMPRRGIAAFMYFTGVFLLLAWSGRIVPATLQNQPPIGLEHNTTLFIQTLDLGLIVPLAFLAGTLLLRRSAWGYLLASVALMKFFTMGLAVSAMGINLLIVGAEISTVELAIFLGITLTNMFAVSIVLRAIEPGAGIQFAAS